MGKGFDVFKEKPFRRKIYEDADPIYTGYTVYSGSRGQFDGPVLL